jgi:mRNA deadenylase 3'-5' endonuclease subunit Ccr4
VVKDNASCDGDDCATTEKDAEKYEVAAPDYWAWSYRQERIVTTLAERSADLVCLQEVQIDLWPDLRYQLSTIGYVESNIQQDAGWPVTTVLLLHERLIAASWRVVLVESRSRALLVTLQFPAPSSRTRQPNGGTDRNTNDDNRHSHLLLANVHWQAGGHAETTRFQQTKSLLQRLARHAHRLTAASSGPKRSRERKDPKAMVNDETNLPVVLLGDWNTLPTDTLHQLLTQTSPLCPDKHDLPQLYPNLPLLPLCDIHLPKQQPGTHGEKETTTPGRPATHTGGQVLDYIFVSPTVQVVDTWIHEAVQLPIPNADFPSDHVPIGGRLRIPC